MKTTMTVTTANIYDLSLMKSFEDVTITFNDVKGYGDSFKLDTDYRVTNITANEVEVIDEEGFKGDLGRNCFADFTISIPSELLDTSAAHEAEIAKLQEIQKLHSETETFAVGDLITWKAPELQSNRYPYPVLGQPAIITEIVSNPEINDVKDTNSNSALRHDIIAGVMGSTGKFITYPFDSRLFKKI